MDFTLNEEQVEIRDLARKILEDRVTNEHLKNVEKQDPPWDAELWQSLAKANLLGVALPEEHGGADLGFFALTVLLQEIGRTVAPVPAYACLALGALPLARFGSDAQKQAWLPGVAEGRTLVTGALSEDDTDDPNDPGARAEEQGDGWRVSGRKLAVPFAEQAARVVLAARAGDRIGLFLVDPKAGGVALAPQQLSNRHPHAQLELDGAPAELLGELDDGASLRWWSDRAIAALCCQQLGVSERALELTAEYGREREQFDVAIGSFQAFHQRAADAYIQVEAMRMTAWEAAWRLDGDLDCGDGVAIAKFWASEGAQFVAYGTVHLHGGVGIDVDVPLHRYFLWATQSEHLLGNARSQLRGLGERIATEGIPPAA
ncbi:MAG: acyl-CoA dehydrogenase family protein [Myxococcota bacterium]